MRKTNFDRYLAAIMTADYLRPATASGRREDFEHYLKAVPDLIQTEADQLN